MLSITSLGITPAGYAPGTSRMSPTRAATALIPTSATATTSYSCTPGYCVQQLQALLNLAVNANLKPGYSFPAITPDGTIKQDTINSILFMANTGIPQFALFDVTVDANWIATNAATLVQSYASYLGIDPSTLISAPDTSQIAPIVTVTPTPTDQPISVMCPDGSSAADISLCPVPLDIGPIVTVTPPPTDQQLVPTPTPGAINWSDWNPYNILMKGTLGWPGQIVVGAAALALAINLGSLLFGRRKRA